MSPSHWSSFWLAVIDLLQAQSYWPFRPCELQRPDGKWVIKRATRPKPQWSRLPTKHVQDPSVDALSVTLRPAGCGFDSWPGETKGTRSLPAWCSGLDNGGSISERFQDHYSPRGLWVTPSGNRSTGAAKGNHCSSGGWTAGRTGFCGDVRPFDAACSFKLLLFPLLKPHCCQEWQHNKGWSSAEERCL